MTKRYKQAREDYEFLVSHHGGEPDDLTGGFVLDDYCFELLKNPTKTKAAELYETLIHYSSSAGFGVSDREVIEPDLENGQVREIYERYGLI